MKIARYSRQKGIATILVVLLLSLAVGATAFSMINSNRNTQTKQVAVHAATHANNSAWAAADALRLYLKNVEEDDLPALVNRNLTMTVGNDTTRSMSAVVRSVDADASVPGTYLIEAEVTATDISADSSALMDVVFRLTPGEISDSIDLTDSVMLSGNLDMTGGIKITGVDGNMQDLSVDGDIRIDQISINSIRTIKATGDVKLGSGAAAETIYANGSVSIKDTVAVNTIWAMGDFEAQGSASVDTMWINGDVTIDSSGSFNFVNTLGDIYANAWTSYGDLKADGNIYAEAFDDINTAASGGNTLFATGGHVGTAKIKGNLTGCVGSYWDDFTDIQVAGTVSESCPPSIVGGQQVSFVPMNPVTEVELDKVIIDTWALKSEANYVLEYDENLKAPVARLYNVAGVPNGKVYYLNKYFEKNYSKHHGYLCEADLLSYSSDGRCLEISPGPAICLGFSDQTDCLTYDKDSDTWTFNGAALAPGVFWFKGDLAMGSTTTTSTLLATGSITTSGAYYGAAVNWFGFDDICLAKNSLIRDTYGAGSSTDKKYTDRFEDYYPAVSHNKCNW